MLSNVLFALVASTTIVSAQTFQASFTQYGSGDSFGSGNCNTNTNACGFFTSPGFAAAASQNLYGAGPGQGAGPACNTCYRLTGETDSSGNPLSNPVSIVVKVTNLCPADGNPLCSQQSLFAENSIGANVNFDLCIDSGAAGAFFKSGTGLERGTAEAVSCNQWTGEDSIPQAAKADPFGSPAPAPTTTTTPTAPTTTTSAKAAPSPAVAANPAQQTLYGQCGGILYRGPTSCVNSSCQFQNKYYSQCL